MKKQNTIFPFYSVSSESSVAKNNSVNPCSSVVNFSYFAQYDIRITQYGSIKIERLCETKPIFRESELNLSCYITNGYGNKLPLLQMQKQSQTNPILSRRSLGKGGFKANLNPKQSQNKPKFTRRSISEGGQSQILGFLTFWISLIMGQLTATRLSSSKSFDNLRRAVMGKCSISGLIAVGLIVSLLLGGCVERRLTINTEPQGAIVVLNDEEIGTSPVTVSFEWYGDYDVRISKEGFETLKTHRKLKAPWYDYFPFDFFANCLNPKRILDFYEWTFTLAPQTQPNREELIQNAQKLKGQL